MVPYNFVFTYHSLFVQKPTYLTIFGYCEPVVPFDYSGHTSGLFESPLPYSESLSMLHYLPNLTVEAQPGGLSDESSQISSDYQYPL